MTPGPVDPRRDPVRWWRESTKGRRRRSVSLERRWFGLSRPTGVLAAGDSWDQQQERIDRYALAGRDDVGLKLRNGRRVGLKVRRCRVDLGDGLPPAERWSRLSARPVAAPPADDPAWTSVAKRRVRRMVDLSAPEPAAWHVGLRRPVRGGSVEVVSLALPGGGDEAWSVAVESWGHGDVEGLRRAMSWAGIDWHEVDAWSEVAGSYPGWLTGWATGRG